MKSGFRLIATLVCALALLLARASAHPVSGLTIARDAAGEARTRHGAAAPHGRRVRLAFRALETDHDFDLTLNEGLLAPGAVLRVNGEAQGAPRALSYHATLANGGWARCTLMGAAGAEAACVFVHDGEVHVLSPPASSASSARGRGRGHTVERLSDTPEEDRDAAWTTMTEHVARRSQADVEALPDLVPDAARRLGAAGAQQRALEADYFVYSDFFRYYGPYGLMDGCPSDLYEVQIGMASDLGYGKAVSNSDTSVDAAALEADLQFNANVANIVLADMANVFLTVAEMDVRTTSDSTSWNQEPSDPDNNEGSLTGTYGCAISSGVSDGSDRQDYLEEFDAWRDSKAAADKYALWHVLTDCFPPSGTVGLAYVGATCSNSATGWTNFREGRTWLTYTHELGHNFGASHTFGDGGIMDYIDFPYFNFTGDNPSQICGHLSGVVDSCDFYTQLTPTCGNGIVEPGEACDDSTKCCVSCQLNENAQCTPGDAGDECCTSECRFEPTTVSCAQGHGYCRNGVCGNFACQLFGNTYACATASNAKCAEHCETSSQSCFSMVPYDDRAIIADGVVCDDDPYSECSGGSCVAATEPDPVIEVFPSIALDAPADGDYWVKGEDVTIAWTQSNFDVSTINVLLLRAGVTEMAIQTDADVTAGSLTFSVPHALDSPADYMVRVEATDLSAYANATVTIDDPPHIFVTVADAPWTAGRAYALEWRTLGDVGDVSVSLVLPDDETAVELAPSGAQSPLAWTIADERLGTHRVVVSDGVTSNSSAYFDILEVHSLTLAAPAESVWYAGEDAVVSWAYTGAVGLLTLSLEDANGSTVAVLADGAAPADGSAAYTVADADVGAGYWLRLADADDTAEDAWGTLDVFADLAAAAPEAGAVYQAGDHVELAWLGAWSCDAYLVANATGEPAGDGALLANAAAPGATATLNQSLPTGAYRVRYDALERARSADSEAFVVNVYPAFTAVATNATWTKGEPATVWWAYYGLVPSVDVLLLLDGAQVGDALGLGVDADAPFSVAAVAADLEIGDGYTVEVRASDQPAVALASSEGHAVRAARDVSISSPANNDTWYFNHTYSIEWTSTSTDASEVTVELVGVWSAVLNQTGDGAMSYAWTVPDTTPTAEDYVVRVTSGAQADEVRFLRIEVEPSLTVLVPGTGDAWVRTNTYAAEWLEVGRLGSLSFAFAYLTGVPYYIVAEGEPSGQGGLYNVTVDASIAVDSYKFIVADSNLLVYGDAFDVVNPTFALGSGYDTTWTKGQPTTLSWSWDGAVGAGYTANVDLLQLGEFVTRIVEGGSADAGSVVYTPPLSAVVEPFEGANYTVRVEWTTDAGAFAETTDIYIRGAPSMTVLSPAGGDEWYYGTEVAIEWFASNVDAATVVVSLDGVFEVETANDGSYELNVTSEADFPVAYDYTVTVSIPAAGLNDTSGAFGINYEPLVQIVHPSEEVVLLVGDSVTVWWYTEGAVSAIDVHLLRRSDGALVDTVIEAVGDADRGVFVVGADVPPGEYALLVEAPEAQAQVDVVVAAVPAIAFHAAADWVQTKAATVAWTYEGLIETADLSLYSVANASLTLLAANVSLADLSWTLPVVDLPLGDYYVQLANANVTAQSDVFQVAPFVFLAVLEPAAGDVWVHDEVDTAAVVWEGSVDSATADLYLDGVFERSLGSADAGFLLLDVVPSDLPEADNYTVKVTDDFDAEHFAWSDAFRVVMPADVLSAAAADDVWTRSWEAQVTFVTQGIVDEVDVLLLEGSTLVYELAVNDSLSAADGVWADVVPLDAPLGDGYRVEVRASHDHSLAALTETFSVRAEPSLAPVEASTTQWTREAVVDVTWTAVSVDDANVTLYLLDDDDDDSVAMGPVAAPAADNAFAWLVDADLPVDGKTYTLHVVASATSASLAGITALYAPEVQLDEQPAAWLRGSDVTVSWSYLVNVPELSLTLTTTEGEYVYLIAEGVVAPDGEASSLDWTVNATVAAGDYLLRAAGNGFAATTPVTVASPTLTLDSPAADAVWTKGATVTVAWSSDGALDEVIVYLLRGGAVVISLSAAGSTEMDYDIPIDIDVEPVPATTYTVHVSWAADPAVFAESAEEFEIRESPYVALVAPAGGEAYVFGESYPIAWTSKSTDAATVGVSLMLNGSALSTDVTDNDGFFQWTAPSEAEAEAGDAYSLRVTANGYYDESPAFSIDVAPAITVASLGASVQVGDNVTVAWDAVGLSAAAEVDLRLVVADSGTVYGDVRTGVPAARGAAWWVVDVEAGDYYVLAQADGTTAVGQSSDFAVVDAPRLEVATPGTWEIGVAQTVSWALWGAVGTVDVELHTTASGIAATLASGVAASDLSVDVDTSGLTTGSYFVYLNGDAASAQSAEFAVVDTTVALSVLTPTAFTTWVLESDVSVTWAGSATSVTVELRRGGALVDTIATDASGGYAAYTVPSAAELEAGDDYSVELINNDSPSDVAASDAFLVEEPASLSALASDADPWVEGASVRVTWDWTGDVSVIDLALLRDGAPVLDLAVSQANIGYLAVDVPADGSLAVGDGYTLQLSSATDAYVSAHSAEFGVRGWIAVGAVSVGDDAVDFAWTSSDSVETVDVLVERLTDGAVLVDEAGLLNTGAFSWAAPEAGDYYRLTVSDGASDVSATSDYFSVEETPALDFVVPTGGADAWAIGSAQTIEWTTTGSVLLVDVWVAHDVSDTRLWEAEDVVNTGSLDWVVPSSLAAGTGYAVHIASSSGTASAVSGAFEVVAPAADDPVVVTVVSPAADAAVVVGETVSVAWTNTGNLTACGVELRKRDAAGVVATLAAPETANENEVAWTVDAEPGTSYYVRVNGDADSDFFSVVAAQDAVAVTSVSDATFERLAAVEVGFSLAGDVAAVDVVLVDEANEVVATLASGAAAGDSPVSWTVPAMPLPARGDAYRVCAVASALVGVEDCWGSVVAVADADATEPEIDISRPRIGDEWVRGQALEVRWTSQGVEAVDVEVVDELGAVALVLADGLLSTGWASFELALDSEELLADGDYTLRLVSVSGNVEATKAFEVDSPNVVGRTDLDVDEPTADSEWIVGEAATVEYDSINVGEACNVTLESSAGVWTLATLQGTAETLDLTVPADAAPADDYVVRVACGDAAVGESAAFSVYEPASLALWRPGAGDTFFKGSAYNVFWNHTGPPSTGEGLELALYRGDAARRTVAGDLCVPSVGLDGLLYADCRPDGDVDVCATAVTADDVPTAEGVCAALDTHLVKVAALGDGLADGLWRWSVPADVDALPSPGDDFVLHLATADGAVASYSDPFSVAFYEVRATFTVVQECISNSSSPEYASWEAQVVADLAAALEVDAARVAVVGLSCSGAGGRRRLLAPVETEVEIQVLSAADLQETPAEDVGALLVSLVANESSALYDGVVTAGSVSTAPVEVVVVDDSDDVVGGDDDDATGGGDDDDSTGGGGGGGGRSTQEDDDSLFGDIFDYSTTKLIMIICAISLCCCCCFGGSLRQTILTYRAQQRQLEAEKKAKQASVEMTSVDSGDGGDDGDGEDDGDSGDDQEEPPAEPEAEEQKVEDAASKPLTATSQNPDDPNNFEQDNPMRSDESAADTDPGSDPDDGSDSDDSGPESAPTRVRRLSAAGGPAEQAVAGAVAGAAAAAAGADSGAAASLAKAAATSAATPPGSPAPGGQQAGQQQQFTPQQYQAMQQLTTLHQQQSVALLNQLNAQSLTDEQKVAAMRQLQVNQQQQSQTLLARFQMQNQQAAQQQAMMAAMAQQQQQQQAQGSPGSPQQQAVMMQQQLFMQQMGGLQAMQGMQQQPGMPGMQGMGMPGAGGHVSPHQAQMSPMQMNAAARSMPSQQTQMTQQQMMMMARMQQQQQAQQGQQQGQVSPGQGGNV